MPFTRTTAINKIRALNKFVRAVQGGTSAGKTYGILPVLIDIGAKHPGTEISIVAESIPHLKRGAMKDFKKIMAETGRWYASRWNATDFKYTFSNGSQIEFFSADDDSKLRGARRDYLYMNECNNMTLHAYTELASRTKQGIYLDWNPTAKFWFHKEIKNDDNVDFIIITYHDNEACPESARDYIEKAKAKAYYNPNLPQDELDDPANVKSHFSQNWYRVYGMGLDGILQNAVFQDWAIVDSLPPDAKYIGTGLDFGFTNDPSALVDVFMQDGELWVDLILYKAGMTNPEIANSIKALGRHMTIIGDSAEPKSIEEIRRMGVNIAGALKGRDSIKHSIDILQRYKINITKRSTKLISEFEGYEWETDSAEERTGRVTGSDHAIDALRYVALNKLSNPASGKYSVVGGRG